MRIFNFGNVGIMGNVSGKVIINGKDITDGIFPNENCKTIDDTKEELANNIKCIKINSFINVNVTAEDTNKIVAHLQGTVSDDAKIELSLIKSNNELLVLVENVGGNIIYMMNMSLDIKLPTKTFEKIKMYSENGNFKVAPNVKAESISVETENGKTNLKGIAQQIEVKSENGNINITSTQKCRSINVITENGKVKLYTLAEEMNLTSENGDIYVASDFLKAGEKIKKAMLKSSNGKIDFSVPAEYVECNTHNGNISVHSEVNVICAKTQMGKIEVDSTFNQLKAKSVTGNIKVNSNAKSNIRLDLESQMGKITAEVNNIQNSNMYIDTKMGKIKKIPVKKGNYIATGRIVTVTGNINCF